MQNTEPSEVRSQTSSVEVNRNNFSEELLRLMPEVSEFKIRVYNRAYIICFTFALCILGGYFHRPFLWSGLAGGTLIIYQYSRLKKLTQALYVERKISKNSLGKGDELTFTYVIWNCSQMRCPPPQIRDMTQYMQNDSPVIAFNNGLEPNARKSKMAKAICLAPAGPMALGPVKIEIQDEMGLFRFEILKTDGLSVEVHHGRTVRQPELVRRAQNSPLVGDLEIPKSGQGLTLFGLREYRDGDPLNSISWKKSTMDESFFVKEFETDIARRVGILISTEQSPQIGYGASSTFELSKVMAVRLIRGYLTNHSAVSLISSEMQLKDLSSISHLELFERVINGLALGTQGLDHWHENTNFFEQAPVSDLRHELELLSYHLKPPALIYYILPYLAELEPVAIRHLQRLKSDGFEPLVVLINPGTAAQQVKTRFGAFQEMATHHSFVEREIVSRFHVAGVPVIWVDAENIHGQVKVKHYANS